MSASVKAFENACTEIASVDQRLSGHGGRLCIARALYPRAPQPWIDLSTGINPKPYPAPRASASARARLPEPSELRELEEAAARAFGVEDASRIVATGGSEAALRLMPYVLTATQAVVVGFTYSSHADAWQSAGTRVKHIARTPCAVGCERSVLILVNPNNPDGALTTRDQVLNLHDELHAMRSHLIVDEAFADIDPIHSVAAFAGSDRYPHLLVLRSFGKFYGLAGLRLGFVIASPPVVRCLRHLLGDWPVTADAIAAGLAAYADTAWTKRTRERLQAAAHSLDALLVRTGFTIVGGTSLFRLSRSDNARERFDRLLRAGILVRPFDHDPTLLRFGLPYGAGTWQRLAHALESRA
jgi:cobalamin biosynthetic protein CobC